MAELTLESFRRMENVLSIYERPLDENQPVVCLDEKPVQVLADARAPLPAQKPGRIAKIRNWLRFAKTGRP